MTIVELQDKHRFKHASFQINILKEHDHFLYAPIEKLQLIKRPIFVIFVHLNKDFDIRELDEVKFLAAYFLDNPSCSTIPESVLQETTHFFMTADENVNEEQGKIYLQRLSTGVLKNRFLIPVENPYKF